MENKIEFLALGDITAEPFIKIKDAEANCDINGDNCKISFRFGEKVPYDSAEITYAVGNSPNVAVGVSRLGIKSTLISYIGDDDIGKKNIESLLNENINIDFIKITNGMKSNYHYVLWYGNERTILVKHTEFPYSLAEDTPEANWLYLSSLASNSEEYHKEIYKYLQKYPDIKLAFQPGTFQIKLGKELISYIYERTNILFCNKNEAKRILDTNEDNILNLLEMLSSLGPKIVILTNGINGAYSYDGKEILFIPIYENSEVVAIESTGAGDSFAAAVLSALIKGNELKDALLWGPINSLYVISKVGAQAGLLKIDEMDNILSSIDNNYKIQKIK